MKNIINANIYIYMLLECTIEKYQNINDIISVNSHIVRFIYSTKLATFTRLSIPKSSLNVLKSDLYFHYTAMVETK